MIKKPSDALARGEHLLREWNIADEIDALQSAWGRQADADLAIANRLGRHADPASVAFLLDREPSATDKTLRKEIRRSLFRLEQRGLSVPKAAAPPPSVRPLGTPAVEAYMSPSDGAGDQLVWIVRPRPQGLIQLFAVLNDPEGMREAGLHVTSRKALRAAREDLARQHEIPIVEVDWRYGDHRMMQAYQWAVARGTAVAGDYLGMRGQILREAPAEVPHPIFGLLDAGAIRGDATLLADSAAVVEEKEFRTWFLTEAATRPYLDEINEVVHSPLFLNPQQQAERSEQVITKAVAAIFGGARQASMIRRLLDVAFVFHATQRPTAARQALANALALEASCDGGAGVPFCEAIVRVSLGAYAQMEQQRQAEEAKSSLIITPQQVRQEARRQRQ